MCLATIAVIEEEGASEIFLEMKFRLPTAIPLIMVGPPQPNSLLQSLQEPTICEMPTRMASPAPEIGLDMIMKRSDG